MKSPEPFKVYIQSFGYLHGLPPEPAHLILDVRKLLYDPHTNPALRELTGLDSAIYNKVMTHPNARELIISINRVILALVDQHDPLSIITRVAIGCSGGRHRSVVLAREIGRELNDTLMYQATYIIHRDILCPVVSRTTTK